MLRTILCLTCLVLIVSVGNTMAQNLLDGPESVAFDSLYNRYLISSGRDQSIVQIDSNGTQSYFVTGLPEFAAGNCIVGDTFYVALRTMVLGFDLETAEQVMNITDSRYFRSVDGVTADTSGYLYVLSTQSGVIYRIDLSNHSYSEFATGFTIGAQDIFFDERHNRILVATFAVGHPIQAVSIPDGTISTLISPAPGRFDGITMDGHGNVYAASYADMSIHMWDSTYSNPGIIISTGHNQPAGIDYNRRDDILAVPNFGGNSVDLIQCNVPSIQYVGQVLDDSGGDNNGHADISESVELMLTIRNDAWGSDNVTGELASDDPDLTITTSSAAFGASPGWGAENTSTTPYAFIVSPTCPEPHVAALELEITCDGGHSFTDTFSVYIGETPGFDDDLESGEGFWSHDSATSGYGDQWHLDDYRTHSGDTCWKFGGYGAEHYAEMGDGALVTPPFLLPEEALLTFWHWIDAEEDAEEGKAWDGGVVMISSGDGEWSQITPVDGYSHTMVDNPASPFEVDTPCFSGNYDWTKVECDLSEYSGVAQIMFRFGSDAAANAEGWYVDDVVVAPGGCCKDMTGNVDGDPEDMVDLGDLTKLIDYLFISFTEPTCLEEANADGDPEGLVDLGDLTKLIDYLFISFTPPTECL